FDEGGGVMTAREDPAHVAVEEALMARRVHVDLGVRVEVMVSVLGGPPQHALLRRALRQNREQELERAAGRIGAMREVTVIAGADREDAQPVEPDAEKDRGPRDASPERREAGEMYQHERD